MEDGPLGDQCQRILKTDDRGTGDEISFGVPLGGVFFDFADGRTNLRDRIGLFRHSQFQAHLVVIGDISHFREVDSFLGLNGGTGQEECSGEKPESLGMEFHRQKGNGIR